MGKTTRGLLVAVIVLLAGPRSARADGWGCDAPADIAQGEAGWCCDVHDICYAAFGCQADFYGRWETALACATCDMNGWGPACDTCFVWGTAYLFEPCFECDHAAALCIGNTPWCPAGPTECYGAPGGYPATNVCGEERQHPEQWLGRGCQGDHYCATGQCDEASGACVDSDGGWYAPPGLHWRQTGQCYADCTYLAVPGTENWECGFLPWWSTCGDRGTSYAWCGFDEDCEDHQCVPEPCEYQGDGECGWDRDSCDNDIYLGDCPQGSQCQDNQCVCTPYQPSGECGWAWDGCSWVDIGFCEDGDCVDNWCHYDGPCGDWNYDCYDDCTWDYVCNDDPCGGDPCRGDPWCGGDDDPPGGGGCSSSAWWIDYEEHCSCWPDCAQCGGWGMM
jgi:hypothetical protein